MAGIGFALRRVVAEDSYSSIFKGYLAAALIFFGPWFLTVFIMALLTLVSPRFLTSQEKELFLGSISYSFMLSLITTGIVQMPIIRMLADIHFVDETKLDQISPALASLFAILLPLQSATVTIIFGVSGIGWEYAFTVGTIYASVSGIWLTMALLGAAKNYRPILWGFISGYVISFTGSYLFGYLWGSTGAIAGFALGQSATFTILWLSVVKEFGVSGGFIATAYRYICKFPTLVIIGFLYNLGIWVDNIMLSFTSEATQISGVIRTFPRYDSITLLAFLTTAPATVVFLVRLETSFSIRYKEFFKKLVDKTTRQGILDYKEAMAETIKSSYITLLRLQLMVVVFGLVFSSAILNALGLSESHLFMFRLKLLGAGLHVFLSATVLVLLYYDRRVSAMLVLLAFVLTNICATYAVIQLGAHWYGYSFLVAEAVASVLAIAVLVNRFRNLEYLLFTSQPITEYEHIEATPPINKIATKNKVSP